MNGFTKKDKMNLFLYKLYQMMLLFGFTFLI